MNVYTKWVKMNMGLIKKTGFYVGFPVLFFLIVSVYLSNSGGFFNFTITNGRDTSVLISESIWQSSKLILWSIFFVILPVLVALFAIIRKSFSYSVAAIIIFLFNIVFVVL